MAGVPLPTDVQQQQQTISVLGGHVCMSTTAAAVMAAAANPFMCVSSGTVLRPKQRRMPMDEQV